MEELNEEEMKNEGGACKTTSSYRRLPGYEHVVTGGRPGNYMITKGSTYELKSWRIKNSKNFLGGSANYKIIDRLWITASGEVWCHTPSGLGTCELELVFRDRQWGTEVRNRTKVQLVVR